MTYKPLSTNPAKFLDPIGQSPPPTTCKVSTCPSFKTKTVIPQVLIFLLLAGLPWPDYAAKSTYPIFPDVKTTRERTVRPALLPTDTKQLTIDKVSEYATYGYSSWTFGDPVDAGALLPDGTVPKDHQPVETLLTFFSMSVIHIVDKESPAQAIYAALMTINGQSVGFGETNTSAYSPIMMSTTHVLDAAVQTINALHQTKPFDFGISLGDDANNNQYNELRWFIDVLDGKKIIPSSGKHRGAKTIDYQKPYQSAGLDKSIPWFATLGNHDQYWCGTLPFNDYARSVVIGNTVLDLNDVLVPQNNQNFPSLDARGIYAGILDGATEFGTSIDYGLTSEMPPPIIAADLKRHALSTETSTSLKWMKEFFKSTSKPKGHGFTQANIDNDFASYTFEPRANLPLKVIVLDDTCKTNPYGAVGSSYARACLDQERYDWLINELDQGQASGQLMIIAAHIPVGPQLNLPYPYAPNPYPANPPVPPTFENTTPVSLFLSTCHGSSNIGVPCNGGLGIDNEPVPPYTVVSDQSLLETLHNYSNLLLWMSGHRHINTVTPQPAPANLGPEFGFWEVETSSLRDFPQQFRTFEIVRNDNNTVSIFVTNVDPAVQNDPTEPPASPAAKSRGYAIGANRIAAVNDDRNLAFTDTASHAYNAELVKPLATPYTLTVAITGNGSGTVKSSPYSGVNCTTSPPCSASYLKGTALTLLATPDSGSAFTGWTDSAGRPALDITMNSDVAVTANFSHAPTLSVTPAYKSLGTKKIGKMATATFTVRNTPTKGVADLVIGNVAITEVGTGQFQVVEGKDHCSGLTLTSGQSCTFRISFSPQSINTQVSTITQL